MEEVFARKPEFLPNKIPDSCWLHAALVTWFTILFRTFKLELLIDENHRAKINIISNTEKLLE